MDFDAIVVGSGISGGWAAKELCERGLKTLLIERGRNVTHRDDYTDFATPWQVQNRGEVAQDEAATHYAIQSTCQAFNSATRQWWVRDSEHPYATPSDRPFHWIRGYHLGGRSITWGRQTYRMSDVDFNANRLDGHGVDWPIRYADIQPWYDRVERFAGISGAIEGLEQLPDGQFLPPLDLNCLEVAFKRRVEEYYPTRRVTPGRCAHLTEPSAEHIALGGGVAADPWVLVDPGRQLAEPRGDVVGVGRLRVRDALARRAHPIVPSSGMWFVASAPVGKSSR